MPYQKKDRWTAKQELFIIHNYKVMKDYQMAQMLGRTLKSVRHKRQRLELEKLSYGQGVVMTPEKLLQIESPNENTKENNNENINLL